MVDEREVGYNAVRIRRPSGQGRPAPRAILCRRDVKVGSTRTEGVAGGGSALDVQVPEDARTVTAKPPRPGVRDVEGAVREAIGGRRPTVVEVEVEDGALKPPYYMTQPP